MTVPKSAFELVDTKNDETREFFIVQRYKAIDPLYGKAVMFLQPAKTAEEAAKFWESITQEEIDKQITNARTMWEKQGYKKLI